MSELRKQVLKIFKTLHRTRKLIFNGDQNALNAARIQINEKFKTNKTVTNEDDIKKLVKLGKDVDLELNTNVIQAVSKEPGHYEVKVKKNMLLENVLFNEDAVLPANVRPKCGNVK